jgi:regulator of replication initiation timing
MGQQVQPPREAAMPADPLADQIANSLRGVRELREDLARLSARVQQLERENLVLESENAAYRSQLESEKTERSYYHRFAVEVATSLNMIAQVCDDVMHKAQKQAFHNNGEPPRQDIPDLEIPRFLQNGPNGNGHASNSPNGKHNGQNGVHHEGPPGQQQH